MDGTKARKLATERTVSELPEKVLLGGTNSSETTPKPLRAQTPPPLDRLEARLERLGPWVILNRDACGKRAVARCCYCQMVREISIADVCVARCGCTGTSPGAGRVAEAQRLPDWRPQR